MKSKNFIILRKGSDTDILTRHNHVTEIFNNFKKMGYILIEDRFYHKGLGKIFPKLDLIDLQWDGLNQNNLIFLSDKYFFNKKYSEKMILNLALLLHLIVNKGKVAIKRKKEFYNGFSKLSQKEKKDFFYICKKEYGKRITKKIFNITKKERVTIFKLKWQIIFKKSGPIQIFKLPIILISNQIYKFRQKRKKYIIAFLGVDGSGKTTTINNLSGYLSRNNIKYNVGNLGVYHERSSFMKLLSIFSKKEKDEKKAINRLNVNYTRKSFLKNFIRTIDIYLRYKKTIRKARKNKSKIILFDRYFYDLILQSRLDFFSRVLLKAVPKPNKLFFLYSNPENIFKRKGERNPQVLSEQIHKFRNEIKDICLTAEIKTRTEKQTLNKILKELNNKEFLTCI